MKVITIGQDKTNDYVINAPEVAKHNTQIIKADDGRFFIVDMGSLSGTYVNGRRISGEHPLKPGDTVIVGNVSVDWQRFFSSNQASAAPHKKSRGGWILAIILGAVAVALIVVFVFYMIAMRKDKSEDVKMIDNLTKEKTEYHEKARKSDEDHDIIQSEKVELRDKLNEFQVDINEANEKTKAEQEKLQAVQQEAQQYKAEAESQLKAVEEKFNRFKKDADSEHDELQKQIERKDGSVDSLKRQQDSLEKQLAQEQQKMEQMKADYEKRLKEAEAFAEAISCGVPLDQVCDGLKYDYTGKNPKDVLYQKFREGHGRDIINVIEGLKRTLNREVQ